MDNTEDTGTKRARSDSDSDSSLGLGLESPKDILASPLPPERGTTPPSPPAKTPRTLRITVVLHSGESRVMELPMDVDVNGIKREICRSFTGWPWYMHVLTNQATGEIVENWAIQNNMEIWVVKDDTKLPVNKNFRVYIRTHRTYNLLATGQLEDLSGLIIKSMTVESGHPFRACGGVVQKVKDFQMWKHGLDRSEVIRLLCNSGCCIHTHHCAQFMKSYAAAFQSSGIHEVDLCHTEALPFEALKFPRLMAHFTSQGKKKVLDFDTILSELGRLSPLTARYVTSSLNTVNNLTRWVDIGDKHVHLDTGAEIQHPDRPSTTFELSEEQKLKVLTYQLQVMKGQKMSIRKHANGKFYFYLSGSPRRMPKLESIANHLKTGSHVPVTWDLLFRYANEVMDLQEFFYLMHSTKQIDLRIMELDDQHVHIDGKGRCSPIVNIVMIMGQKHNSHSVLGVEQEAIPPLHLDDSIGDFPHLKKEVERYISIMHNAVPEHRFFSIQSDDWEFKWSPQQRCSVISVKATIYPSARRLFFRLSRAVARGTLQELMEKANEGQPNKRTRTFGS